MVATAYRLSVILVVASVAACTRPPVIEQRVVEVPGPVEYVPVPDSLLTPCVNADTPTTNGELLVSWESLRTTLDVCNTQLSAIGELGEGKIHGERK